MGSPTDEGATVAGLLDADQVQTYRRDGFVIVPGALSDAEVDELRRTTDEFMDRARAMTENDDVIELDIAAGHRPETPKIRRIKSPHKQHPVYAAMLEKEELLDTVEQLIGGNIRWHHTKLNAKAPGGGTPVEWHTDWGYYPHTNDDLLEIGIAIDDITTENGCLHVLAGSHLGPAWDHYEDGRFVGAVPPHSFEMDAAVPLVMEAGDISIHHVRALHGSAPNLSEKPRRLLLQGYAAADAWPLMAHHQPTDWPEWDARILRGEPTVEARLGSAPVRIPLPLARALGLFDTQQQMRESHYEADVRAARRT